MMPSHRWRSGPALRKFALVCSSFMTWSAWSQRDPAFYRYAKGRRVPLEQGALRPQRTRGGLALVLFHHASHEWGAISSVLTSEATRGVLKESGHEQLVDLGGALGH